MSAAGRINLLQSNGTTVPTHIVLRSLDTGGAPNVVVIVTYLTEIAAAQEKLAARYRDPEIQFQESLSTYCTQVGTAGVVDMIIGETEAPQALKILILEDEPTDAELMQRTLRDAGLDFTARRVDNRADFIEALETFAPDVVLSDYPLRPTSTAPRRWRMSGMSTPRSRSSWSPAPSAMRRRSNC